MTEELRIDSHHRLNIARWLASSHHAPRPHWAQPELVVIHCISLPEGHYGGGAPQRLFTGDLDCTEHASFADLEDVRVSAHLFIDRQGAVDQFVGFDQQAWHAGLSMWRGRGGCNAFSIGIELEGKVGDGFTEAQYLRLDEVLVALLNRYPSLSRDAIAGHADIAPGRKEDPGAGFDWQRMLVALHREPGSAKTD